MDSTWDTVDYLFNFEDDLDYVLRITVSDVKRTRGTGIRGPMRGIANLPKITRSY